MITYARKVGRLVELRARGEYKASNAERARQRARVPGMHVVRIEDEARALLKPVLSAAEPQGVQASPLPLKVVRTPEEAIAALKDVLDAAELQRAKQFLEEK